MAGLPYGLSRGFECRRRGGVWFRMRWGETPGKMATVVVVDLGRASPTSPGSSEMVTPTPRVKWLN